MRGKWESAISGKQLDNVLKETHAVSVMMEHLETDAIRDKTDNHPLLHQKRRHRLTERNPQKVQVAEEKVLLEHEVRFRAKFYLGENVRARHVLIGTLSVCLNYKSESECTYREKADPDALRLMGSPAKIRRKSGVKGSVALLKESIPLGCVSQDSHPRKSFLRKEGKSGSNRTVKFSKGTRVHREELFKSVNLMSAIRELPVLRKEHKTKPCSKKDAPAE